MSEEQKKPKLKWYEVRLRVFVLLLPFICAAVAFIWAMDEEPCCSRTSAYNTCKDEIQNAVTYFAESHKQSFPILNGTYTNSNCSNCHVLNITALITANGGLLREAPDGLNLSISGNDNCGGNASLGCYKYSSYIWIVDNDGNVFSYCAGAGCATNNSDFQNVWP